MVRAWLMDNTDEDQRLEHHRTPPVPVSMDYLKSITGVLHCKIDPEREMYKLDSIRRQRGYSYEDVIEISPQKLPNLEYALKNFYKEHLHTDEEIRFILEGSGYFDVRCPNEDWVRIALDVGDLLVLPAGIYHRFTLDTNNYAKAMRLFMGEPVWTPHYRPADHMDIRKQYVQDMRRGFISLPDLI